MSFLGMFVSKTQFPRCIKTTNKWRDCVAGGIYNVAPGTPVDLWHVGHKLGRRKRLDSVPLGRKSNQPGTGFGVCCFSARSASKVLLTCRSGSRLT